MHRAWILLLIAVSTSSGCAMCCGTDDYNYAAYGGKWERSDMSYGRVGSALEAQLDRYAEPQELPFYESFDESGQQFDVPPEPVEEIPRPSEDTLPPPPTGSDI